MALENFWASLSDKYDEFIALGAATAADKADVIAQQNWYVANKAAIDGLYPDKWIAIANQTVFAADDLPSAEQAAIRKSI